MSPPLGKNRSRLDYLYYSTKAKFTKRKENWKTIRWSIRDVRSSGGGANTPNEQEQIERSVYYYNILHHVHLWRSIHESIRFNGRGSGWIFFFHFVEMTTRDRTLCRHIYINVYLIMGSSSRWATARYVNYRQREWKQNKITATGQKPPLVVPPRTHSVYTHIIICYKVYK